MYLWYYCLIKQTYLRNELITLSSEWRTGEEPLHDTRTDILVLLYSKRRLMEIQQSNSHMANFKLLLFRFKYIRKWW